LNFKPDAQSQAASIRPDRMKAILDGINAFGRNGTTGGFDRTGFSDADMEARRWLAGLMEQEGLAVSWDAAGNLFGRLGDGNGPSVMAGSHTDTVPDGGAFDGALGVAAALECALAIRDAGLALAHPIEIVDTAEEEGRFGGMLGSQAMAGLAGTAWVERARDPDGLRLWDAMERQGFDPSRIDLAARKPGEVKAFLELHIEQGPVLERAGTSVVGAPVRAEELLRRPEVGAEALLRAAEVPSPGGEVLHAVETEVKYQGYVRRERARAERLREQARFRLSLDLPYGEMATLAREAREKLARIRPENLAQAGRIPGVSPADLQNLVLEVKRRRKGDPAARQPA
jgi:hypothetical protein